MQNSIEFFQVAKAYGAERILVDFSLAIPAGVTTALVGESGSGKSTLLMLSNGLIAPDAGRVSVMGLDLAQQDLIALRRRTGYAVQGAGLFPHLTVKENIALMAGLSGWSGRAVAERIERLFGLFGLDPGLLERYPHGLSGGQQQRVSLCRAMMLNPPLLLLDEPFSALDPLTRDGIHDEFERLQEFEPRSILLVTHDMSEATRLARYIVVLRRGEVVRQGSVTEVLRDPADDYVRRLLGQKAQ